MTVGHIVSIVTVNSSNFVTRYAYGMSVDKFNSAPHPKELIVYYMPSVASYAEVNTVPAFM